MKRILLLFGFFVITTTGLYAQVGIGTRDPHPTAQLEVKADNKGVLIPRVELKAIGNQSPIVGTMTNSLLVYNTVTNTGTKGQEVYPGYYFWYKDAWNRVVSQNDFSNTDITNKILKGSNIVTYNSKSNTLNYYTKDGTQTSVNIVDVINKTDSSTTINIDKITPAKELNKILATVTSTVNGKVVTVTEWRDPKTFDSKASDLTAGNGIKILQAGAEKDKITGVLTPFTLEVKDLDISSLVATSTVIKEGDVLVVKDGKVTTTSSIDASKIQSGTLSSDGSVTVSDGAGAVLKDVTIKVGKVNVDKLEVGSKASNGDILIVDKSSGNNSVTYTSTTNLIDNNITKGNLTGGEGVSVDNGNNRLVGTGNATIKISNLPVDKLEGGPGNAGKILTVEKGTGSVTWTSNLPEGTTVSITNIKGEKGSSGTTTKVVVIDPATGNATTTSITELVSNTVKVGNGLSKDSDGKIVLGGDLEKAVTTITAADDKKLAIKGLTNTATTTDDKVMVLGKDNVLHTVSITSLKGSGDYTTITNTTEVPDSNKDKTTGNTFTDEKGKTKPERVRTVLVTADGSTSFTSKLLNVGAQNEVLITDIKVLGAGADYRSVLSSIYEYKCTGGDTAATIGLGLPGNTLLSSRFKNGNKYYVVIKYVK